MELRNLKHFWRLRRSAVFRAPPFGCIEPSRRSARLSASWRRQLGETLFDRAARDGSLTASGELLRDYAQRLLALRREAIKRAG